jgi:hypothetical protein
VGNRGACVGIFVIEREGTELPLEVEELVGELVGELDVGACVGCTIGKLVGGIVGEIDGESVVGYGDGIWLGTNDGKSVCIDG